jgi:acyl phosphate:glycerol-3-phosphate acyltransferase
MLILVTTVLLAYFVGSFNAAYWFGRWFIHTDIRSVGSKNAGATNLLRVAGWKIALPAFLIDAGKSFLAVNLAFIQNKISEDSEYFILLQISLGLISVIGHIFPVYIGFRGGKGVASLLGMILAIHPIAALASLIVFILSLIISKIVSISSVLAAIAFPLILIFAFDDVQQSLLIFAFAAMIILLISHRKNLKRLLNGEEKRISFK